LAKKYNIEQREIVRAAIDDETGNSAFHYCAANNHTGI